MRVIGERKVKTVKLKGKSAGAGRVVFDLRITAVILAVF
jgi:hypothetical protein